MKDQNIYLEHITIAIKKVQRYTKDMTYDDFYKNDMAQDAVIRQIEIIGEAANKMDATFRQNITEVKWREIIGMRNKLIHDYAGVLPDRIWETIRLDLPDLDHSITKFLDSNE